jgi:hypothetical protein
LQAGKRRASNERLEIMTISYHIISSVPIRHGSTSTEMPGMPRENRDGQEMRTVLNRRVFPAERTGREREERGREIEVYS